MPKVKPKKPTRAKRPRCPQLELAVARRSLIIEYRALRLLAALGYETHAAARGLRAQLLELRALRPLARKR
jgi:hypothetical protein